MHKDRLIKILFERLDIAMEFEKDKKIVIPETTFIIRDLMKITDININEKKDIAPDKEIDLFDFDDGL